VKLYGVVGVKNGGRPWIPCHFKSGRWVKIREDDDSLEQHIFGHIDVPHFSSFQETHLQQEPPVVGG